MSDLKRANHIWDLILVQGGNFGLSPEDAAWFVLWTRSAANREALKASRTPTTPVDLTSSDYHRDKEWLSRSGNWEEETPAAPTEEPYAYKGYAGSEQNRWFNANSLFVTSLMNTDKGRKLVHEHDINLDGSIDDDELAEIQKAIGTKGDSKAGISTTKAAKQYLDDTDYNQLLKRFSKASSGSLDLKGGSNKADKAAEESSKKKASTSEAMSSLRKASGIDGSIDLANNAIKYLKPRINRNENMAYWSARAASPMMVAAREKRGLSIPTGQASVTALPPEYVEVGKSGGYGTLYYDTNNKKRVYRMNNSSDYKELPQSYSWELYENKGYLSPSAQALLDRRNANILEAIEAAERNGGWIEYDRGIGGVYRINIHTGEVQLGSNGIGKNSTWTTTTPINNNRYRMAILRYNIPVRKQGGPIRSFLNGGKQSALATVLSDETSLQGFITWFAKQMNRNVQETALLVAQAIKSKDPKQLQTLESAAQMYIKEGLKQSQMPISAKQGTKMLHLMELNGKCPEGFEIEKYLAGGCVKCSQLKKKSVAEEMKCGGKKRFTSKAQKGEEGYEVKRTLKSGVTKTEATGPGYNSLKEKTITYQGKRYTSQAYIPDTSRKDTVWNTGSLDTKQEAEANRKRFYQHLSIYNKKK